MDLVRKPSDHGFPYLKALKFERAYVPRLIELLRDKGERASWSNAMFVLGVLGDPRGVQALIEFVEQDTTGDIDREAFGNIVGALLGLGHSAESGSEEALEYLLANSRPEAWMQKTLPWSCPERGDKRSVASELAKAAVYGLGRTTHPRALAELKAMTRDADLDWRLKHAAEGALSIAAAIEKRGRAATFDRDLDPERVGRDVAFHYGWLIRDFVIGRRPELLADSGLARQGKPVVTYDDPTGKRVAQLVKLLQMEERGLEWLRRLALDLQADEAVHQGDPKVVFTEEGDARVSITLLNSETIAAKYLPGLKQTPTVDERGRLVIFYIRERGQWYWNPFGW